MIAELDAKSAHFKSLADPIDTTTPQGRFALQVLGAVAELERGSRLWVFEHSTHREKTSR